MSPVLKVLKSAGRCGRFWDWVSQIAADDRKMSATSVTMKGGIRNRVTALPLSRPMNDPTASITMTATGAA
jgi:hypothetical protein